MTTRRGAVFALLGAGVAAAVPSRGLIAAAATTPARKLVVPATLTRPNNTALRGPFVPLGEARTLPVDYDYIEEEWFASGTDDLGQPYVTQVVVRRPRDRARFSGTLIVEPLHLAGVAPIYMYSSRYIMRSGHAWACIASQKMALETHVKKADAAHYASLHIEAGAPTLVANQSGAALSAEARQRESANQASNAIIAQVATALRVQGPMAGYNLRHLLLVGHSQTGRVTTNFIKGAHASHRRAGGAPIFDGFLPTGNGGVLFEPREVPLIQVVSEGDISNAERRQHRRADSDDPKDRYRLYELAGIPHMGTRNPPNSDPVPWSTRNPGVINPDTIMNSFPHNELFNMSLNHLVQWVGKGINPPRAGRIEISPDDRTFAKDEHGNSRGGVRCVQMDVPRAMSIPNPRNPDGSLLFGTFGFEVPFDKPKMQQLYGTPAAYSERFNRRLQELIREGWFLGADATSMRDEALAQKF